MPHAAQCTVHKKPASPLRFFRDISAKVISSREALLWTGRRRNTTNAVNSDKYWVVQDALLPFFHFVTPFNSADERKNCERGFESAEFPSSKRIRNFPQKGWLKNSILAIFVKFIPPIIQFRLEKSQTIFFGLNDALESTVLWLKASFNDSTVLILSFYPHDLRYLPLSSSE